MGTLLRGFGLASALLMLAGCITDPVTGKSTLGVPTSEAEEIGQGASFKPVIVQQYGGAYPDDALQDHLRNIVLSMARDSVRSDLPWEFTVLNSSVPNAFAVPGGQVFVTRGLLVRTEDEAEFAVYMGHEIGHVEHKHGARRSGTDLLFGAAVGITGAVIEDNVVSNLIAGAGQLFALRYSRDQERESDVRGVYHSYHHQYDPRQGADVFREFQKMKEEAGAGGESFLDAWTASHPLDAERIESVQRLSAEIDPRLAGSEPVEGLRISTPAWKALIARLREEQVVYQRYDKALAKVKRKVEDDPQAAFRKALPTFEACARELPGHATFVTAIGLAHAVTGDRSRAIEHLQRAADLNQGLVMTEYLLGEVLLADGQPQPALRHANRSLRILPDYYPGLFVRAEALRELGRKKEAKADYRQVLELAPEGSREHTEASKRLRR